MESVWKSALAQPAGGMAASFPQGRSCCGTASRAFDGVLMSRPRKKHGRGSGALRVRCQVGKEEAKGSKVFKSSGERWRRSQKQMKSGDAESVDLDLAALSLSELDFMEFVDSESRVASPILTSGRNRDGPISPPKLCTLRAFGGGEGVMKVNPDPKSVYELLAANVEAAAQVRNFETISGRLAMMAFFIAIGVELLTGNSVFRGVDLEQLLGVAALCGVATLSAAGFAFGWRVKGHVVSLLSKGCQNLVDSAIDKVVDGLFFDENTFP